MYSSLCLYVDYEELDLIHTVTDYYENVPLIVRIISDFCFTHSLLTFNIISRHDDN